ncbi:hypothetical protein CONLIGDRAFT_638240 [Coniochaeta ligniaria NRRL 30616]|uniref:EthD domain-containing protein n=1 Tax=Coniochaeta ligniaria NRRL 30616 TaxID=1408157 RepID=A0A1J7I540_9PEZI|nr:hypothetical protein CONLIGDRAFT_638240 [Coniochaeta ligniaria NRRL 30616]
MAVRVTLLIKKLDRLSYDEFDKYWEGPHADIFLNVPIVKEKVLKFSQFHTNRDVSIKFAALGFPISEFDGGVDIWVASVEDMVAIIQDPEYQRLVVPDGKVFSKTEESKIMIGYDKEFIAHGTTAMG